MEVALELPESVRLAGADISFPLPCSIPLEILTASFLNEMLWTEATQALARFCGYLNPEDLLRPFLLMWLFKKLNLFRAIVCNTIGNNFGKDKDHILDTKNP